MIFVIGPLFSGKTAFVLEQLHFDENDIIRDVQNLVKADMKEENIATLAEEFARNKVVIATENGSGVVPIDAEERARRELAGRLNCLLAEKAETVVRICCGLPLVLKGSL